MSRIFCAGCSLRGRDRGGRGGGLLGVVEVGVVGWCCRLGLDVGAGLMVVGSIWFLIAICYLDVSTHRFGVYV